MPLLDPLTGSIDLTIAQDDFDFRDREFPQTAASSPNRSPAYVCVMQLAGAHRSGRSREDADLRRVEDAHADMVVALLGTAMEARYGSQDEALIRKITGSIDRPGAMIRRFQQRPNTEDCRHRGFY